MKARPSNLILTFTFFPPEEYIQLVYTMSAHVETTGSIRKAELKWDFRNVTSLEWQMKNPGEGVLSPDFHADDDSKVKWCIQIFPNGDTEEYTGWISAFSHCRAGPAFLPIHPRFTITAVFDEERKNVWSDTLKGSFGPNLPYGYGWRRIVQLDEVLTSNFFSLVCQIEYADPNPSTKVSGRLSRSLLLSSLQV